MYLSFSSWLTESVASILKADSQYVDVTITMCRVADCHWIIDYRALFQQH